MTVHGRSCLRRCVKSTRATPVTYGQIGGQGALFFWGGQKCSSQSGGEGRFLTSQSGGRFLREEVFLFFFSLLSHCSLIALSPPSGQILLSLLLSFLFCFSFSLSLSPTPPSPPGQIPFSCILLSVLVLFAFARALSLSHTSISANGSSPIDSLSRSKDPLRLVPLPAPPLRPPPAVSTGRRGRLPNGASAPNTSRSVPPPRPAPPPTRPPPERPPTRLLPPPPRLGAAAALSGVSRG